MTVRFYEHRTYQYFLEEVEHRRDEGHTDAQLLAFYADRCAWEARAHQELNDEIDRLHSLLQKVNATLSESLMYADRRLYNGTRIDANGPKLVER